MRPNVWTIATMAIALLILAPILIVVSSTFADSEGIWQHLSSTVLPTYIVSSLILMVGVGLGVTVIGVSTAWLVTSCRFMGSGVFEWALLLPLAAPAYLLAYTYTDFLEYFGPIQTTLRHLLGVSSAQDYWFPQVRSIGGAIAMLVLVLYPYVYLLTRAAFLEQSVCTLEASRSLGCNPWTSFFKVALPLARPAIAAGISLTLMETLSDFGTVQYFGVQAFTTGIYRAWFDMGSPAAASQLASVLLLFILTLVLLEQWSRRQNRYYQNSNRHQRPSPYRLQGWRALAAWVTCFAPVGLGFLLPAGLLLQMAIANANVTFTGQYWEFTRHSLLLGILTAALAVGLALVLAYGVRLNPSPGMNASVRTASIGYAIPGAVIAVGVLGALGWFDTHLAGLQSLLGVSIQFLLSGTIAALVFAYLVRFLTVSFNAVDASLCKIKPSLDDAARSLGNNPLQMLLKVHIPMIGSGLMTAAILVFVDVMKELPATWIIRPFNFDTLAVRVYRLASDERLAEASAPALTIVVAGIVPVILLSLGIRGSRRLFQQDRETPRSR